MSMQKPSASAGEPARAHAPADEKTRARQIIEAALAKKKGGGHAHGPHHDPEAKGVKSAGQFSAPPTRPGQRGRRG